jgi:ligand-binding sensor domain-containing protein
LSGLELVEDEKGVLWLGTDPSGLHRLDPATGHFTKYEHDMNRPGTLSDNRVNSVYFDHSGTMWVGTQNGLDKFDRKNGTFIVYKLQDGLPFMKLNYVIKFVGDTTMQGYGGKLRKVVVKA